MPDFITAPTHDERLRHAVSAAWGIFARKVGGKTIPVNKEASIQLQYAYILRQLIPLTSHSGREVADIELETGVKTKSGTNEIDILLKGESAQGKSLIAIELKCYRAIASSGGPRGAHDIFMKDVYEDLDILEEYVVNPKTKGGKCWADDISDGHSISGANLSVPVGGKQVSINLQKSYKFNWSKFGGFWFMELEGV